MMNLMQYMEKTGVTKSKYVKEWIKKNLIPGVNSEGNEYSFPDSARRPYCDGHLKAGLSAEKIRAHIIKATLARQHITASACYMSNGEFQAMISDLVDAGLVRIRIEDDITYYDSTQKSEEYTNRSLREIGKYVQECMGIIAKNAAEGATKAVMSRAMAPVPVQT